MQKISWRQPRNYLKNRQYQYVVGLLILSVVLMGLRNHYLPSHQQTQGVNELVLSFELSGGQADATEVRLPVPISTAHHRVLSQTMEYPGWRIKQRNYKELSERGIRFLLTDNSPKSTIRFQYVIDSSAAKQVIHRVLTSDRRQLYLKIPQSQQQLLNISSQPQTQIDNRQQMQSFLQQNPVLWHSQAYNTDLGLYGCEHDYRIQQRLLLQLRAQNIPSRFVCGLMIAEGAVKRRGVVESYLADNWHIANVPGMDSQLFIPFYRGDGGFFKVDGPGKITFKAQVKPINGAVTENQWQSLLDLRRLPLASQQLLEVVLILPLAVLVIAYLRLVWQIPMLGSLTPALLGMALAFNEIWLSLVLLLSVLLPLFWIRHLSQSANKIVTHGLTLTFITLLLIILLVVLDAYAVVDSPSDIILPTVLLVLFIDKYYQSYNKRGAKQAHWQLITTLSFAFMIVPVVQFTPLGYWLLCYPELHLITLALLILLWQKESPDNLSDTGVSLPKKGDEDIDQKPIKHSPTTDR